MIVGMILAGGMIGAMAAGTALVLGQGVWIALLIYSGTGTGTFAVLAGAALVARQTDPVPRSDIRSSTRPQRG